MSSAVDDEVFKDDAFASELLVAGDFGGGGRASQFTPGGGDSGLPRMSNHSLHAVPDDDEVDEAMALDNNIHAVTTSATS